MTTLPVLRYSTAHQPEEQAFETWRKLMAPIYGVVPRSRGGRHPGGSTTAYLLGDLMANRTLFSAQAITRDRKRVDATPDHVIFQFWRTGGYRGQIQSEPVAYGAGTVALSDRRRTLAGQFAPADTVGVVVPRPLLAGLDLDRRGVRFDPARNRLLQARLIALYRELPQTDPAQVPALRNELLGFCRRVLDPSSAKDVLEGAALDRGQLALAHRHVLAHLGEPDLSPASIAASLGISRATLYRAFAPRGGVMGYVQDQRYRSLRDALADPHELRSIAELAAAHGLTSLPSASRGFRARFGMTAREWRQLRHAEATERNEVTPDRFWAWFHDLGRKKAA